VKNNQKNIIERECELTQECRWSGEMYMKRTHVLELSSRMKLEEM
jgi:hypothetical protein